jgi:hypothetical protein
MTLTISLSSGILNAERERWYSHILKVIGDNKLSVKGISEQLWLQGIKQNGKIPSEWTVRRYLKQLVEKKMVEKIVVKPMVWKGESVYYGKV